MDLSLMPWNVRSDFVEMCTKRVRPTDKRAAEALVQAIKNDHVDAIEMLDEKLLAAFSEAARAYVRDVEIKAHQRERHQR